MKKSSILVGSLALSAFALGTNTAFAALKTTHATAVEAACGNKKEEGKCGDKKAEEGKCGDKKADAKKKEGKCGDKKANSKKKEGKCGEGKCGDKKSK